MNTATADTASRQVMFDADDAPPGYTHDEARAWAAGMNKGVKLGRGGNARPHGDAFVMTAKLELALAALTRISLNVSGDTVAQVVAGECLSSIRAVG